MSRYPGVLSGAAGVIAILASLSACNSADRPAADTTARVSADTSLVQETFVTVADSLDNVDSPTVYHGPDGMPWIIASAKGTHQLIVYDAATGSILRRVGSEGSGAGELRRPNGVLALGDSLLLVVERDNRRVQGFSLPDFKPVGVFGDSLLRYPYGVTAFEDTAGAYHVYVTDNYETPDEQVPPVSELGERVKHFRIVLSDGALRAEHIASFGDTTEAGAIRVAESILADPVNDRLIIAEEIETDSHLKVYTLDGRFTGRTFGRGYFPQQAEGIALYACGDTGGYWVTTDQGDSVNTFHLFDRQTFEHAGQFTGAVTRRTDGIALTQGSFGPFASGVLFASHVDAAVTAISWDDIAAATGARSSCTR